MKMDEEDRSFIKDVVQPIKDEQVKMNRTLTSMQEGMAASGERHAVQETKIEGHKEQIKAVTTDLKDHKEKAHSPVKAVVFMGAIMTLVVSILIVAKMLGWM